MTEKFYVFVVSFERSKLRFRKYKIKYQIENTIRRDILAFVQFDI